MKDPGGGGHSLQKDPGGWIGTKILSQDPGGSGGHEYIWCRWTKRTV